MNAWNVRLQKEQLKRTKMLNWQQKITTWINKGSLNWKIGLKMVQSLFLMIKQDAEAAGHLAQLQLLKVLLILQGTIKNWNNTPYNNYLIVIKQTLDALEDGCMKDSNMPVNTVS